MGVTWGWGVDKCKGRGELTLDFDRDLVEYSWSPYTSIGWRGTNTPSTSVPQ